MGSVGPTKIFISYSHADRVWLDRFKVHLKPLIQFKMIDPWSDEEIVAGDNWKEAILAAIREASIVVALITADFLASDFIMNTEIREVFESKREVPESKQDGAKNKRLVPIIIKPSVIELLPQLVALQAANELSRPIAGMNEIEQESTFVKIVKVIVGSLGDAVCRAGSQEDLVAKSAQDKASGSNTAKLSQDEYEFLQKTKLGQWEMIHLSSLADPSPFRYTPRAEFQKELNQLLKKRLIQRQPGKGFGTAMREGGPKSDLHDHFFITENGARYLNLMKKLGLGIKDDMS